MRTGNFASSIRRSWQLASQLELGRSFSMPTSLAVDPEFRDLLFDQDSSYEQTYLLGLKKSHYNFIIDDFSYFQFSLFDDSVRYAFFPNPFDYENEELSPEELETQLQEGLISFEDYADLVSESLATIGVPPFRYEFAPSQYREIRHPCSHFHIGHHSENRWPVERKLTPLAFTMLIMRSYHSKRWERFADDGHDLSNSLDGQVCDEKRNCSLLGNEFFTDNERLLFYFA